MKSFLETMAEMRLTDAELPWHDMMNGAVGMLHLNDISRKNGQERSNSGLKI